jgi:lipopolysaccharide transport system ATP-binding protein
MSTVIRVENLGKKYIIRHQQQGNYQTLREVMSNKTRNLGKRVRRPFAKDTEAAPTREEFWALKDVSFEVKQGDRLGIIGRNGAGKSTLLKILSRITEPTTGRVAIKGRVASLLEVGTGFHPELTGRENIYLNGAILGMSKAEIKKKFDEIVDFAEVEKFLDTPVKRYSSGMYVRLAFAVAAHLEPEILIVDEVLAVGDAQFQKKCLGKMDEVGKEGRTVIFVSHNMTAIKALCNKGILLANGSIEFNGDIENCVKQYLAESLSINTKIPIINRKRETRLSLRAKISNISIINDNGENQEYIDSTKPFIVRFNIFTDSDLECSVQFSIMDSDSRPLIHIDSGTICGKIFRFKKGLNQVECQMNPTFLVSGDYRIDCGLSIPFHEAIDFVPEAYLFSVSPLDPYRTGYNIPKVFGSYHVHHSWSNPMILNQFFN